MTIHYRIDLSERLAHLYHVTLTLPSPAPLQQLSLPVWIPGSYMVREFARHLQGLEARQGRRVVPLTQLDKTTWSVACSGGTALTLSYRVYAKDASVRTAWLDDARGFFNASSLCLRAHGREAERHELSLAQLPRGWQVATAMSACREPRHRWHAANYDELIDHPFELGRFWQGRFKAGEAEHLLVVAGAWPDFDGARLLSDTEKIVRSQIAFWHGRGGAPMPRYVFMLNAVDDAYGGLEHRASTALIAARRDLPQVGVAQASEGYVTLLGLISHEYFHTWNVKRLRPREFQQLDYGRENYTRLLWFFEGFTSYYDDVFVRRAGLISAAQHLKLLTKAINQVWGTPGRQVQSVAEASFDAWNKYYRPDENTVNATVSYYTKGALVALALDLRLRQQASSLDELMRELWRLSDGGPIDEAMIIDAARALVPARARASLRGDLARWVHGREDLPLQPLLADFGVAWSEDPPGAAQRLGARIQEAHGRLSLQSVLRGGAAEAAGLSAGDELIALDDWRLRSADDLQRLGAFTHPTRLIAARDQRLIHLDLDASKPVPGAIRLELLAKPAAAALKRRVAWLD